MFERTNTFNDFVDAGRGLIAKGYTAQGMVTASGGSAGGELMGAIINQDPKQYGAIVAHVPFVDVLGTMLNEKLPLTPGEWQEWGNPIESKEAFAYILSYSPYDQGVAKDYPPMLVTAGLNDPRVTYWEPAKWVAKLREVKTDDNLLLLKTNMGAGHGGGSAESRELRAESRKRGEQLEDGGHGGSGSGLSALDFFRREFAEEAGGFKKEDHDEDREGDRVFVGGELAAADEGFDRAEDEAAESGAGYVADAAEDRGDERLETGHDAHERVDRRVVEGVEDAAGGGEGGAEAEGE
jgi:hypothetical protein